MYSTFKSLPKSDASASKSSAGVSRPKRAQVSRACEWCRIHRIKCDDSSPCGNCGSKGVECSRQAMAEVRTLSQALREIGRLKGRIKELETQIETHECLVGDSGSSSLPSPPLSTKHLQMISKVSEEPETAIRAWDGVQMSSAHLTDRTQYYGPSSSFYFINRMSTYLNSVLQIQKDCSRSCMQPNSASRSFASPTTAGPEELSPSVRASTESSIAGESLTPIQEDYFLNLFWQSYHCIYQILDEEDFKDHYRSLWSSSTVRKPSALVDIVLALCMQYGVAFLPRNMENAGPDGVDGNDATIAGRWLYRRSQVLLNSELESPSLSTIQCQIFAAVYLCNASFHNMAHIMLGTATRTAQVLGLHRDSPSDLPRAQQELRNRIWWTLYSVEIKASMKNGRPSSAKTYQVTCPLPSDDHDLALQTTSSFASVGSDATWLTYSSRAIRLHLIAEEVHTAFYERCGQILARTKGSLYDDLESLEECGEYLATLIEAKLKPWVHSVPNALQTPRQDNGISLSIDGTLLLVELFSPAWLQRQRLLLELFYHNICVNTYRPFIRFPPAQQTDNTATADRHANSAVKHAQAMTLIMHQIFTSTEILNGWVEAFQWQWNATLTLIGFMLAYPESPLFSSAREAADRAVEVFEKLGKNFAQAASAANFSRHLTAKADVLAHRKREGKGPPTQSDVETLKRHCASLSGEQMPSAEEGVEESDISQDFLADFLGTASSDGFNGFEPLWPGAHDMDLMWNF